jgi:hypothetical protein
MKEDKVSGACGMHTEVRTGFWWGNLLGRCRHRLEDSIKMDLRNIGWNGTNWIHLAKDRDNIHAAD